MDFFVSFTWKVIQFGFLLSYCTDVSIGKSPANGPSCRHILREKEGYIKSPNYPNTYPNNFDCIYTVAAAQGEVISLDIEDLILEPSKHMCNFDYLMIYDGKDMKSPLLRTFCGRAYPETIYSSGNSLTLQFSTDDDGRMKGFMIKYKIVKACYKVYTDKEGEITSLGYPSLYPNNFSCKYVFKVPRDQSFHIKFTDFYLEKVLLQNCFDYVQISIWNGTDWETSGDVFCANEPPKDICVDSKDVMIHFISDNIITKRGFKAVYEIRGMQCDGIKDEELKASVGFGRQSNVPAEATDGAIGIITEIASHIKLKNTLPSLNTETDATKKLRLTAPISLTARGLAVSTVFPSSSATIFATTTDLKTSDSLNPVSKSAFASQATMENISSNIKERKSSLSIPKRTVKSPPTPNIEPRYSRIQADLSSRQRRIVKNQSSTKLMMDAKEKRTLHTRVETAVTEWSIRFPRFSKTESDAVPIEASSLQSPDMIVVASDVSSSKHTALTTTIVRPTPSSSLERLRTEVNYDLTLQSRIEPSLSVSQEDLQTLLDVRSSAKILNRVSINSLQSISDASLAVKLNGTQSADVDSTLFDVDASVVLKNPIITSRISFVPYLREETQISSTPKLDAQQLLQISLENMNTISRASTQAYRRFPSLLFQEDRSASILIDEYGLGFSKKIPTARVVPLQPTVASSFFTKSIYRVALQRGEALSSIYQNKKALASSNAGLHQRLKSVHASAQLVPTKKIGRLQVVSSSFSTTKEVEIADLFPAQSNAERIVVRTPTARNYLGKMRIPTITKISEAPSEQGPGRGSSDAETMPPSESPIAQSSKETKNIIHSSVALSDLRQNRIKMTKAGVGFSKVTEYTEVDMIIPTTEQFLKRKKPWRTFIVSVTTAGANHPKANPSNCRQTRTYKLTKAPQVLSRVRENTEVDSILPAARSYLSNKKSGSPSMFNIESKRTDHLKVTSIISKQTQTPHLSRSASSVLQLKVEKSFTTNYRLLNAWHSSTSKMTSSLSTAYELNAKSMFTAISSHPKQLKHTEFSDVSAVTSALIDLPQTRVSHHTTRLSKASEESNLSRIPSAIRLSFFRQTQKPRWATKNEHSQANIVSEPLFSSSNSVKSTEIPTAKSKITKKDKRKRMCRYPWPMRRLKFMHLIRICPLSKNKSLRERKSITSIVSSIPSSKYVSPVSASSLVKKAIVVSGLRSKAHLDEPSVLTVFDPSFDTDHFQVFPKLTVDSADESKYLFFSSPRRDIIASVSDKNDEIPSNSVFESSVAASAIRIDYKVETNAEMKTDRLDTILVNDFSTELPITVALNSYTKTRTFDCTSHTSHALVSGSNESIQTPVNSSLDATSKVTETTPLQGKMNSTKKKIAMAEYGDHIRLHTYRSLADDFKLLESTANHKPVKLLKSPSLADLEFGDMEAGRQVSLSLGSQPSLTTMSVVTESGNARFSEHPEKGYIPSSAEVLEENAMDTIGMSKEPIMAVIRPSPSRGELRPYKTIVPRQDFGFDFIFDDSSLQLSQTKTRNYADYRSITYGYNIFNNYVLRTTTSNLYRTPPLSSFLENDSGSVQNVVSETFSSQQFGITDKQLFRECTERKTLSTPKSSLLSSTEEEKFLESSPSLKEKDIEEFATTFKQRQFMVSSNSQSFRHHGTATIYSKTSDLVLSSDMETERPEDASVMDANKFRSTISTSGKSLSSNITDRIVTRLPMFLRSLLLSVSTSVRSLLPKSIRIHERNKITSIIDANSRKVRTSSINFQRFPTPLNQFASRHFKDVRKKESVEILEDRSRLTTPSIVQKILRLSSSSEEAKIRVSMDFTAAIMYSSTVSSYLESTKSSVVAEKLQNQDNITTDSCSGHFVADVDKLKDGDDLKWQALDILSLKLQRIIAVRWPYDGYLGRIGFLHRGYVVQTKDGRLWYSHVQETDEKIYIVSLGALTDLHKRVRIIYSHKMRGITLDEHTRAWGLSIGMYIRDCKSSRDGQ